MNGLCLVGFWGRWIWSRVGARGCARLGWRVFQVAILLFYFDFSSFFSLFSDFCDSLRVLKVWRQSLWLCRAMFKASGEREDFLPSPA